jgi:hypothetical protein
MEGADSTTSEKFWLGNWAHSVMTHFDCEQTSTVNSSNKQQPMNLRIKVKLKYVVRIISQEMMEGFANCSAYVLFLYRY